MDSGLRKQKQTVLSLQCGGRDRPLLDIVTSLCAFAFAGQICANQESSLLSLHFPTKSTFLTTSLPHFPWQYVILCLLYIPQLCMSTSSLINIHDFSWNVSSCQVKLTLSGIKPDTTFLLLFETYSLISASLTNFPTSVVFLSIMLFFQNYSIITVVRAFACGWPTLNPWQLIWSSELLWELFLCAEPGLRPEHFWVWQWTNKLSKYINK